MDKSYLSDQAVVKASRDFICIRLATYEDQKEADFMTSIYRFRDGELENSLFAILDSTGRKHLARPGRLPRFAFRDASEMAKAMHKIAKDHPGKKGEKEAMSMPYIRDLRLAMNVAACDIQRLVIVFAEKDEERSAIEKKLPPLVWSDAVIDKILYVSTMDSKDLTKLVV